MWKNAIFGTLKNFVFILKKMPFFHHLFSLKITLETGFNNVLKRKEPFFTIQKKFCLKVPKEKKELFFYYKRKVSESPKNRIFPKWLTHTFGQKMPNFHLFKFGQKMPIFSWFVFA